MVENVRLSSSEIGFLWTGYEIDDMALCFLDYFTAEVKEEEIRKVLQVAKDLAKKQ